MTLQPFEWKDRPALIEYLFPVQKISAESFKEQMAVGGKTLTALGSYWKGRKPLILNKSCLLGTLLPATDNRLKDLEIFELLMGMDSLTMQYRIEAKLSASKRHAVGEYLILPYNEQVKVAKRPEELDKSLFDHIWKTVNMHLGTEAFTFPELLKQIGIARFGHRPKVADLFCGSGQIPFEAARLGCDVYASDLNPIACLLTWGTFNIVGTSKEQRALIDKSQKELTKQLQKEIDALEVETDRNGWRGKVYLYCVEVVCPESGWKVPLISSLVVSTGYRVVAKLVPNQSSKRYDIIIKSEATDDEMEAAIKGTIDRDSKYSEAYMIHEVDGITHRTKISTLRGDFKQPNGIISSNLRMWGLNDFTPRPDDIFQERLYCVQWMRPKKNSRLFDYEFRAVTKEDMQRERKIEDYIAKHITEWQEQGFIPKMKIEIGGPPRYQGKDFVKSRGWTHWHHLFNPRQLLVAGIINKHSNSYTKTGLFQVLNNNCRGSRWNSGGGGGGLTAGIFDNQALNSLFNYGCRGTRYCFSFLEQNYKKFPLEISSVVQSHPAKDLNTENDIYITDPPYGDAVKYEEITDFFISWLQKNPPPEFAHWTWDSRRPLAIKGEDEGFRQGMIAAYRKMAQKMPDNGIQVLMFTHQSGSIWGDMANIIWASGLQVTAAWYVVTESDSAIRQGANVTGTIMLVLRKRHKNLETFRDDLGWEIEEAVKEQVESLIGLDKSVRAQGSEGLYTDADLQMAGYAAALKVLTAYSTIDGKNMVTEAETPRQKGKKTFVDELIDFAVQTAVQFLVPVGFEKGDWQKLAPVERFYLKMAEMEHQGGKTLDNYQNFAKAFKIHHFDQLMSDSSKANSARLKLSTEFKGSIMSGDAEIAETLLRALLYAMYEVINEVEIDDVLLHLMENYPNYLPNKNLLVKMADYLAIKRGDLKPTKAFRPDTEASAARIIAEAIRNQRL